MKFRKISSSWNPDFQCGGAERTDIKKLTVAFRIVETRRMKSA